MIVCPVCEHAQAQGSECEVCGKRLLHGAGSIPFVAPVEGLDPTRYAPVDAAAAELPDLDPTGHAPVEAAADAAPDLDRGRAAPVDVAGEVVPGLEHVEASIPGDGPTPLPAIVTCRYCRAPAAPGERVCGRCGMRLPIFSTRAEETAPPRRCSCGASVTGSMCPACGARR